MRSPSGCGFGAPSADMLIIVALLVGLVGVSEEAAAGAWART